MKLQIKLILLVTFFSLALFTEILENDLFTIKKDEIKQFKIDCKKKYFISIYQ